VGGWTPSAAPFSARAATVAAADSHPHTPEIVPSARPWVVQRLDHGLCPLDAHAWLAAAGLSELRSRAESLTTWKLSLGKGVLPTPDQVEWPQEPFKSKFMVGVDGTPRSKVSRSVQ
jgi:hypothetical protein